MFSQEPKRLGRRTGVENVGMNGRRWKHMPRSAACKYRPTLCSEYGMLNQNKVKEPNDTVTSTHTEQLSVQNSRAGTIVFC
jgi:hypothetical protein